MIDVFAGCFSLATSECEVEQTTRPTKLDQETGGGEAVYTIRQYCESQSLHRNLDTITVAALSKFECVAAALRILSFHGFGGASCANRHRPQCAFELQLYSLKDCASGCGRLTYCQKHVWSVQQLIS